VALGVCGYMDNPYVTMVALVVAAIGIFGTFAVFWTLPTAWLSGSAAAGAIALINSIGNLAGFGGPYLIGWSRKQPALPRQGCWCSRSCRWSSACRFSSVATRPRRNSQARPG
jgi:nitrate/nitrite transporter NarK